MTCSSARERQPGRDAAEDLDFDEIVVVRGERREPRRKLGRVTVAPQSGRPERARLHVLAREVPLPLERAQVVVHPVRRADPHPRADLAERGRVAAVRDRLADEVEDHLLALSQALHVG